MLKCAIPAVVVIDNSQEPVSADYNTDFSDSLGNLVANYLYHYLEKHKEHLPVGKLYTLVMKEVEKPLLSATLKLCEGNQKKTSHLLGINRNTLRKKMIEYDLIS